jgi:hypothetical protein
MERVLCLSIRHIAKDQLFEKFLQDSKEGRLEEENQGTRVYKNGNPKIYFPEEIWEKFYNNPSYIVYVSLVSNSDVDTRR